LPYIPKNNFFLLQCPILYLIPAMSYFREKLAHAYTKGGSMATLQKLNTKVGHCGKKNCF
jgi:hypothetical protein